MVDPQYSCGDMGKSGEMVEGGTGTGLVLSERGHGTHLLKVQRDSERRYISPSTSGHLLLSCPAISCSTLICPVLLSGGFLCLIIAILARSLSLQTTHRLQQSCQTPTLQTMLFSTRGERLSTWTPKTTTTCQNPPPPSMFTTRRRPNSPRISTMSPSSASRTQPSSRKRSSERSTLG
jgi:hypothetical protein